MISVSRAGWNARPPDSTTALNRSRVDKFIVHYSGASRDQSVRSIQNFCMDVKDHVDIDYNRIVRGEYDYMGRGWNVGGHTLNNNSTSYGVCVIGFDADVTDADKRTVREIYDQVCRELGRQLIKTTHRGVLGTSYTDCPGTNLHNWVMSGMPYPEGGDVANEDRFLPNIDQYHWEEVREQDPIKGIEQEDGSTPPLANLPLQRMKRIESKIDELAIPAPAPVDPAALKAVLLDPEVLAAIANAVVSEEHRRLQS